jgi:hypothetical protein
MDLSAAATASLSSTPQQPQQQQHFLGGGLYHPMPPSALQPHQSLPQQQFATMPLSWNGAPGTSPLTNASFQMQQQQQQLQQQQAQQQQLNNSIMLFPTATRRPSVPNAPLQPTPATAAPQ